MRSYKKKRLCQNVHFNTTSLICSRRGKGKSPVQLFSGNRAAYSKTLAAFGAAACKNLAAVSG